MPEGLNEYEKLQAGEIAKEVVEKLEKHFVKKEDYVIAQSNQNIKIYTIYGILGFLGFGGMLAIIGIL